MDEPQFLSLYNATARPLRAYLISVTGQSHIADDVLQETYFRVLARDVHDMSPVEQRRYLFRIATNLVHDRRRGDRLEPWPEGFEPAFADDIDTRMEAREILRHLKPKERALLWLAYVEGMTHAEIASITGLSSLSIRPMLFHLRKKAAIWLTARKEIS
jgi:RNA polymerase sigma-70 factor (ECF subfamily)